VLKSIISFLGFIFGKEKSLRRSIKNITGFYPTALSYYKKAFIHKSASLVNNKGKIVNNERLEYLGDAVLDLIIGDFLFKKYPDTDEGFLTQTRSKIVNRTTLHDLTKLLKLHHLLKINTSQNISKKNIYGDALEAFIGAVYLDKGYKIAYDFVKTKIIEKHIDIDNLVDFNNNYKSLLIEWSQKYKTEVSFYTELEHENSKYFISYVRVENENWGKGIALSKKEAEQKAAKETMEYIKNNNVIEYLLEKNTKNID